MFDIPLWPWGLFFGLLLLAIGWLIRDILAKKGERQKEQIIRAQEKAYVELADKHVNSRQRDQKLIDELQAQVETAQLVVTHEETIAHNASTVDANRNLIVQLHDEIDRLRIENQKLSSVPSALYIEKIKTLKERLKARNRKLSKLQKRIDVLHDTHLSLKKKYKKKKYKYGGETKIVETIDYKKLKKILKNLPTKRIRIQTAKKDKKQKGNN